MTKAELKTIQTAVDALVREGKAYWKDEDRDGTIRTLIGIASDGQHVHLQCIVNNKDWVGLAKYLERCPTPEHW